jgi:hypothetical protein
VFAVDAFSGSLNCSAIVMKAFLILFLVLNCGEVLAAPAKFPTWNEICYLLEVKKESKVFREFCRHWQVQEFHKRKGSFSGPGGVMINCAGDDVVIVGVRVAANSIALPFNLKPEDDPISASMKVGFALSTEQKKKDKWDYLEVIDSKHGLVLYFMNGHLFEVWKENPNKAAAAKPAGASFSNSQPLERGLAEPQR